MKGWEGRATRSGLNVELAGPAWREPSGVVGRGAASLARVTAQQLGEARQRDA